MKTIINYISIGLVLVFFMYLEGLYGILEYLGFVFIYSIIFYIFHIIWRKLRKKEVTKFKKYIIIFLQKVSLAFVILSVIIGLFTYYQNKLSPAKMPEYTISNGDKTVVFQAMSHIGSDNFYKTIKKNLTQAKTNGYVYFFEGVKPGKKENMESFNKALGIEFSKDLYKNFSKIYGVSHQDNTIYYNLVNDLDFNIDVGIDDIMEEYKKILKLKTLPKTPLTGDVVEKQKEPIDINSEIIQTLSKLNKKELKLLVYINKSILNFIIKSDSLQGLITNNFANKDLFEIILNGRNNVLADGIINSKYKKIYVTYGLLHFKGVLKLLQENDKNWKIISTNYLVPIE